MTGPGSGTVGGAHAVRRRSGWHVGRLMLAVAVLATLVGCLMTLRQSVAAPTVDRAVMVDAGGGAVRQVPSGLRRLVVYGHSIPSGVGASRVSHGYAVRAAEATGLRLVNHSHGGTSAASAAAILMSAPPVGPRDAVVIHTGLNDIFKHGQNAAPVGRVAIRRMLSRTTEAGRRVLVLDCQPASWAHTPPDRNLQAAYEHWNDMLRDVASFWPGVDVLGVCARWDAQRYTDDSRYHPNDDGHALLARQLAALLHREPQTGSGVSSETADRGRSRSARSAGQ